MRSLFPEEEPMRITTRTRRTAIAALGALAVGSLLAACGAGTPGGTAGGDGGEDGVTTIQFWHRSFTPVENEWYANIVKEFNKSQDEIKVVDTEVPADAWDQKMKAAQAAGKAPDVYTSSANLLDLVNAGSVHELDSIVSKEEIGRAHV